VYTAFYYPYNDLHFSVPCIAAISRLYLCTVLLVYGLQHYFWSFAHLFIAIPETYIPSPTNFSPAYYDLFYGLQHSFWSSAHLYITIPKTYIPFPTDFSPAYYDLFYGLWHSFWSSAHLYITIPKTYIPSPTKFSPPYYDLFYIAIPGTYIPLFIPQSLISSNGILWCWRHEVFCVADGPMGRSSPKYIYICKWHFSLMVIFPVHCPRFRW
jgi:hypothetical protein